jgi:hypothetical protein
MVVYPHCTDRRAGWRQVHADALMRSEDPRARRWILIPEAAPLLFQAGLDASEKSFQLAVVRLQMAMEDSCAEASSPFVKGKIPRMGENPPDPIRINLSL